MHITDAHIIVHLTRGALRAGELTSLCQRTQYLTTGMTGKTLKMKNSGGQSHLPYLAVRVYDLFGKCKVARQIILVDLDVEVAII